MKFDIDEVVHGIIATLDDFSQNLWKTSVSEGGTFRFVKIAKHYGAKFTYYELLRDYAYDHQKLASEHRLAPPVFDKFSFKYDDDNGDGPEFNQYYGYITAYARSPMDFPSERAYKKLEKELEEIGIYHSDLNESNVGYYKRKLVCIDFDRESCDGPLYGIEQNRKGVLTKVEYGV